LTYFALVAAASAWAGMKPVAFRLASLPASAEQGHKLVLCAANIGAGAAAQPCVTMAADDSGDAHV